MRVANNAAYNDNNIPLPESRPPPHCPGAPSPWDPQRSPTHHAHTTHTAHVRQRIRFDAKGGGREGYGREEKGGGGGTAIWDVINAARKGGGGGEGAKAQPEEEEVSRGC
jgi:hypothetical protein